MKILVIGLGSMGKRRIRLIKELGYSDIYGVDGREDRRKEANALLDIKCFASIRDVSAEKIECAFICTSPLSHSSIIEECLNYGWNVFTELNLVSDGYENNMLLAKENKCTLFLSSTFLYREEIRYIRETINNGEKWNYVYHIGQYLPDWHPWENYKDFFVGDKRTNGCREIMAIELPWILKTFGDVVKSHVISDKMTSLNIDYHDNYMIELAHERGNKGVLIVDVVSPCAVRRFEGYKEGAYIQWSGTPESLMRYNFVSGQLEIVELKEKAEHKDGYRAFVVENAYKNEIEEFFAVVNREREPQYDFEQDLKVLRLIDSLER